MEQKYHFVARMTSPMLIDTLKDGNAIKATGTLRIMSADLLIFF